MPNTSKILSFWHIINIKFGKEIAYILFFHDKSLKSGIYITVTTFLNVDWPHFSYLLLVAT